MGGGTMNIDLPINQLRTSSSNLSSLSFTSNLNLPDSANHSAASFKPTRSASCCCCGSKTCRKLELANGKDARASGFSYNSVFGPVPSQSEVQTAASFLQNFGHGISPSGSELKWLLEMVERRVPRTLLRSVYDAFQLWQTDPWVQRLVVSIASDKAVWDAIMNNELVRKLREPLCADETGKPQNSNEEADLGAQIWRWICEITKLKVVELIEKFQSLMDEMFYPPQTEKGNPAADGEDQLRDKLRSSLLLSVVVILVVVVARLQRP
ncbi:uncharacterized protein LOC107422698 [Ziziphus jujuba]|uniref:Uncharacterized protein LOC107422698 n=1 Tax=Ziziphus jujuba TaxID=326968 RepID=A0A6P4AGP3_ZIZJJ|nr:uncharacterized protein LOC107422698 [Ziziphus jujuba]